MLLKHVCKGVPGEHSLSRPDLVRKPRLQTGRHLLRGGQRTSDDGALLLREIDYNAGLCSRLPTLVSMIPGIPESSTTPNALSPDNASSLSPWATRIPTTTPRCALIRAQDRSRPPLNPPQVGLDTNMAGAAGRRRSVGRRHPWSPAPSQP